MVQYDTMAGTPQQLKSITVNPSNVQLQNYSTPISFL